MGLHFITVCSCGYVHAMWVCACLSCHRCASGPAQPSSALPSTTPPTSPPPASDGEAPLFRIATRPPAWAWRHSVIAAAGMCHCCRRIGSTAKHPPSLGVSSWWLEQVGTPPPLFYHCLSQGLNASQYTFPHPSAISASTSDAVPELTLQAMQVPPLGDHAISIWGITVPMDEIE